MIRFQVAMVLGFLAVAGSVYADTPPTTCLDQAIDYTSEHIKTQMNFVQYWNSSVDLKNFQSADSSENPSLGSIQYFIQMGTGCDHWSYYGCDNSALYRVGMNQNSNGTCSRGGILHIRDFNEADGG